MDSTSRLTLSKLAADHTLASVADLATAINGNATKLDTAILEISGAGAPSSGIAGIEGRIYRDTTSGRLYYDTGSVWAVLLGGLDTEWVNLTVATGTAGTPAPQARKIGNLVQCRGEVEGTTGGMVIDLPDTTWLPTAIVSFPVPVPGSSTTYALSVTSSAATLHTLQNMGTATVALDTCRWFTD
jgi:hypothetical protein